MTSLLPFRSPCTSRPALLSLALLAALVLPSSAVALGITFAALDLDDVVPGEDRWLYHYELSGFSYPAGHGFSVLFDPALYAALEIPKDPETQGWDVLVLQPDANLPADGLFDALLLIEDPRISLAFDVAFTWLGATVPGFQAFLVYDLDFETVEQGLTGVPEPGTAALFGFGLATLVARGRRS